MPLAVTKGIADSNSPIDIRESFRKIQAAPQRSKFFARFPVGVTWARTLQTLEDLFLSDKTPLEKIVALQETYLYSIDQNDAFAKKESFRLWQEFFVRKGRPLESLPNSVRETEFYDQNKVIEYKGKKYSLDLLSKINLAQDIVETVAMEGRPFHLVEVGGGYGQLARTISLLAPSMKYVCLDLPETLAFAYLFLSVTLPDKKTIMPSTLDETKEALTRGDYDFCLIPCFFAEAVAQSGISFAAAVNKSSFGEMEKESTRFYLDLFQKDLDVRHMFLLNRLLNSIDPEIQSYRLNESQWYNCIDSSWDLIEWELEPEFTRFPYNEIHHQREVYVIAKRRLSSMVTELATEDIFQMAWYKDFTIWPFPRHSKILADNFKKGGTLERLVNAVRMYPTERNLDALIKYIYLLEGKFPFEERFFYAGLFRELTGKKHFLAATNPYLKYNFIKFMLKISGIRYLNNQGGVTSRLKRWARVFGIDGEKLAMRLRAFILKS